MVAEILPAQLSVAVGGVTVTEHWSVITCNEATSATGAVASVTITY